MFKSNLYSVIEFSCEICIIRVIRLYRRLTQQDFFVQIMVNRQFFFLSIFVSFILLVCSIIMKGALFKKKKIKKILFLLNLFPFSPPSPFILFFPFYFILFILLNWFIVLEQADTGVYREEFEDLWQVLWFGTVTVTTVIFYYYFLFSFKKFSYFHIKIFFLGWVWRHIS